MVELEVSEVMRVPFECETECSIPAGAGTFHFGNCLVYTPAVFVRVASKGVAGYGTWKKIRKTGDGTLERLNVQMSGEGEQKEEKTDSAGLTGLTEVRSRNHDSCYHKLFYLSTTI